MKEKQTPAGDKVNTNAGKSQPEINQEETHEIPASAKAAEIPSVDDIDVPKRGEVIVPEGSLPVIPPMEPTEKGKDQSKDEGKKKERPTRIDNEKEAVAFVRNYFKVPQDVRTIWVAEDTNIFYRPGPAQLWANEQGIKLFAIQWD